MQNGILVVISGFSGTGKTSVVNSLLSNHADEFVKSVSVTTRVKREDEIDGKSYFFKSKKEFERLLSNGEILEWTSYAHNLYGTPKSYVEEQLLAGKNVILILNTEGAKYIKENFPNSVLIFLTVSGLDILKQRLVLRGEDSEESISLRLLEIQKEVDDVKYYDYIVENDILDTTTSTVYDIINASKYSVRRNINMIDRFKRGI